MKKIITVFALILLSCLRSNSLADKARMIVTAEESAYHAQHICMHINTEDCHATGNYIKVRTDKDISTVVGHLEQADNFILLDVEDEWAKIEITYSAKTSPDSFVGMIGWVDSDYVDCNCTESQYLNGQEVILHTDYESVLDWFYTCILEEDSSQDAIKAGFEPFTFVGSLTNDGYLCRDLDGNGIDELIILPKSCLNGSTNPEYGQIIAIYTLENDHPVRLITGMTRSRHYLRKDGKIYHEGSNGAGYAIYDLLTLHGAYFEHEFILSDEEQWYYTTDRDYNFENDVPISFSQAQMYVENFSSQLENNTTGFISFEDYGLLKE